MSDLPKLRDDVKYLLAVAEVDGYKLRVLGERVDTLEDLIGRVEKLENLEVVNTHCTRDLFKRVEKLEEE